MVSLYLIGIVLFFVLVLGWLIFKWARKLGFEEGCRYNEIVSDETPFWVKRWYCEYMQEPWVSDELGCRVLRRYGFKRSWLLTYKGC